VEKEERRSKKKTLFSPEVGAGNLLARRYGLGNVAAVHENAAQLLARAILRQPLPSSRQQD